jgi:hypothetical protein
MDLQALVQFIYLRVEQRTAHEIEAATRAQMQRFPDKPPWRSALAALRPLPGGSTKHAANSPASRARTLPT